MFDWLFEGVLTVYLVLLVALLVLLALWWRDRRKRWLYAAAGVALLVGLYALLDLLVETPFEQARRKIQVMAAAVRTRDFAGGSAHISERFEFDGRNKKQFVEFWRGATERGWVGEVAVWDFRKTQTPGVISFQAKPKGPNLFAEVTAHVEAEFAQDPDGQWRLVGFRQITVPFHGPFHLPTLGQIR